MLNREANFRTTRSDFRLRFAIKNGKCNLNIIIYEEIAVLQLVQFIQDFAINKISCNRINARQAAVNSTIQTKPVYKISIPALALTSSVSNNIHREFQFHIMLYSHLRKYIQQIIIH